MKKIYIIILFFLIHLNLLANEKKPIEIIADSMEWNKQYGQAIAKGNAQAIPSSL